MIFFTLLAHLHITTLAHYFMNWKKIESENTLKEINLRSHDMPQLIFKHSTRCSISSMALNRMTSAQQPQGVEIYYLDLLNFRNLSNQIASDYHVPHESPQILLIKNEQCVYHATHSEISMRDLVEQLK
jgi:bacillithiol system protein YtxJ